MQLGSRILCVVALVMLSQSALAHFSNETQDSLAAITPSPSAAPTKTAPPTATITPTASPIAAQQMSLHTEMPLEITFDGVYSLSLEFRDPIRTALEANASLFAPIHRFTVTAFRDVPGWAKITLVPTSYVESGWSSVETISPYVVEVIARETSPLHWQTYVVGSAEFASIASGVPADFVDLTAPFPPLAGDYKFPWQHGQAWWAINGWHDGSAIDFEPSLSARYAVLAAQSGFLREICSDGYQSFLQMQHADGQSTFYLHVTLSLRVRRTLLDHAVRQGQYLGELVQRDLFRSPCGRGYSRHLHFVVTDRQMMMDGFPISGIADSASCCSNPPLYVSTNERVDDSGE